MSFFDPTAFNLLPGRRTDNQIHKCSFIWLSTRIINRSKKTPNRSSEFARVRNLVPRLLRHIHNVAHSKILLATTSAIRKSGHNLSFSFTRMSSCKQLHTERKETGLWPRPVREGFDGHVRNPHPHELWKSANSRLPVDRWLKRK